VEKSLFDERFLLARPVLAALRQSPSVLLVDEVDRADDEFEAFLLEVLSTNQVSIPEYGTVRASTPPFVVLTSNRTREIHDALKRRCLYYWIDFPNFEKEYRILSAKVPEASERLATQICTFTQGLRDVDLFKSPGMAETLDWAQALLALGSKDLSDEVVEATLGVILKYQEDVDKISGDLTQRLVAEALDATR
jgi:MoxR-like ATPase